MESGASIILEEPDTLNPLWHIATSLVDLVPSTFCFSLTFQNANDADLTIGEGKLFFAGSVS